tara:strand:+ start:677 stop:916 length:240 start_codon:yes stop_codon:yes gene_type:complete
MSKTGKKFKYKGKPSEILEPIEFEGCIIKNLRHGNTDQLLYRYPRREDGEPCWTTDIDKAKASILYWKKTRRSILDLYT